MYSMIRRKSYKLFAVPVAILCALYLLCYTTVGFAATKVHVAGTLSVEAVAAEFTSLNAVDNDACSATYSGNEVQLNVAGMKGPGASAVALITAKNTGTLDATVVDVQFPETTVDYIVAKGADIPVGEVLAPGEECNFEVAVYWDPARDDILSSNEETSFTMVITYENDEYIYIDGETVPKTGDDNGKMIFGGIAIASGVILIVCIILFFIGKKKKKEEEDDA